MSSLITYSSNTYTCFISEYIAKRLDMDSVEVKDLNIKSGIFNNIKNNYNAVRLKKTEIKPGSINLEKYDLIFFGTPSVLGNPAPAMITMIDKCDFKNKRVILFTTTNSKQGANTLNIMKKKIENRGGVIVNSFIIRVNNKTKQELIENTIKVLYALDLDLYL